MVNYANGKVYKIESSLGDKIYIGSTTKSQLSQRMTAHRDSYKRWKAGKCNMLTAYHLFDEYGVENCKIVLLEDCPCESKDQLSAREAHYIRTLECVNKVIPLRTYAEYCQDNREAIAERYRAYNQSHRDEVAEQKKAYRDAHRAEILEQKKAYYQANREALLAKGKAYFQDKNNRDKINERRRARNRAKKAHKNLI